MYFEKYNVNINSEAITDNLKRLLNQTYKLLPCREEGDDWQKPLQTIIEEFSGMARMMTNQKALFSLLCKLEGLMTLTDEEDFLLYRRTIFECISLIGELTQVCLD